MESAGIGRSGGSKAEAEEAKQFHSRVRFVVAAMEMAQAVQAFDGQSQEEQQPANQQAVGMMMSDVFETIAILGVIKALVFDFPARLGHSIQAL